MTHHNTAFRRLRQTCPNGPFSQVELAKAAGMAFSSISRIETGRETPRPSTCRRLAQAMGVPAAIVAAACTGPEGAAPTAAAPPPPVVAPPPVAMPPAANVPGRALPVAGPRAVVDQGRPIQRRIA